MSALEERPFTVELRVDVVAGSAMEAADLALAHAADNGRVTAVFDEDWNETGEETNG